MEELALTPTRQALRRLIAAGGYTMVPGAYDTLTARLVEQAGFAAVYLTGGGYSRASGYPDLDAAAVQILKLASPFDPFPPELSREYRVLRFAYEWQFTGGRVERGGGTAVP